MAKKKTITQRQDEIENKLDMLIKMLADKQETQTEEPEPVSQPPPKEDFVHQIKNSGPDSTHNYGKKEQMPKINRPNIFNDNGTMAIADKKIKGTQTYATRRPPADKVSVRCIKCGQDFAVSPKLASDRKRYRCNDCCCSGI